MIHRGELVVVEPADLARDRSRSRGHSSVEALAAWLADQLDRLKGWLCREGGVLFRGFSVQGASDFERVLDAFGGGGGQLLEYVGGHSPRGRIQGRVYESTSAPAVIRIPLHSEMSYLRSYPRQVIFYCHQPAALGGETPIADTRRIHRAISPRTRERFEAAGVCYIRHLADRAVALRLLSRAVTVAGKQTWQGAFESEDQAAVDARCQAEFTRHAWSPDRSLKLWSHLPAVREHPVTGERVWFNQAHMSQVHPRIWGPWLTPLVRFGCWVTRKRSADATFGDDTPIDERALGDVMDAIEGSTTTFPWARGDVLVLDNLLKAHGRNPFAGRRKVMVGLLA